jgi:hemerythrin
MPFAVWNDRLSVGVDAIDEDHKKLIAMINDLYDAILAGRERKKLDNLLDRLVDYTRYHFAREEKLLARTGYPDVAAHKHAHSDMAAWIKTASRRYHNSSAMAPSLEAINHLTDWFYNHILSYDQKFAPHLKAHRIP